MLYQQRERYLGLHPIMIDDEMSVRVTLMFLV